MMYIAGQIDGRKTYSLRQIEIGNGSAFCTYEVSVRLRPRIVARTLYVVKPTDDAVLGEFVQNPVNAFPRDAGNRFLDVVPNPVNIRVLPIAAQIIIDRQPLRSAFPADATADVHENFMFFLFHNAIDYYFYVPFK